MNRKNFSSGLVGARKSGALLLLLVGCAWTAAVAQPVQKAAPSQVLDQAAARRAALAESIGTGETTGAAALQQIQAWDRPFGFADATGTGKVWAAIDLGQRVLAMGNTQQAIVLFSGAEALLSNLVGQLPDAQASTKAAYLQKLAWLRATFLNKPDQAASDLAQAIRLRPDDPELKKQLRSLAASHATAFQSTVAASTSNP